MDKTGCKLGRYIKKFFSYWFGLMRSNKIRNAAIPKQSHTFGVIPLLGALPLLNTPQIIDCRGWDCICDHYD
jgi:hypothetical protein